MKKRGVMPRFLIFSFVRTRAPFRYLLGAVLVEVEVVEVAFAAPISLDVELVAEEAPVVGVAVVAPVLVVEVE